MDVGLFLKFFGWFLNRKNRTGIHLNKAWFYLKVYHNNPATGSKIIIKDKILLKKYIIFL